LVRQKIGNAIRRAEGGGVGVRVGLLTKNPHSDNTEALLAVVCEFGRAVSDSTLALCHRLAWNFARSPLLVTIEPHQVRTWTCCEPPAADMLGAPEIEQARLDLAGRLSASEQAAHALNWVRLASGDFYRQFPDRFRRDGRADRILLEQLTYVRKRLRHQGLEDDTTHDLLARVVFSKFLFDRKDADGDPAINPGLLSRLHEEGHLAHEHADLASILANYAEAYRFFRWLNDKFNGDLFPGKGQTPEERDAEWREEMDKVQPVHLQTLANFVSGRLRRQQRMLFQQYLFDVIPLEFISSIYEEFVTTKGAHYTPGFLVDFMLDEVLPWSGREWDLKVLDPACGSGIFLVKAYQRLIRRWKNAHPGQKPSTDLLRRLLERNLFGVDLDPHAVRVASFSLYLTMCDEIDPKTYLKSTKFPRLRDRRLIHADFFQEDVAGFSTERDGARYDLVIGNAPWGRDTETTPARGWAEDARHPWPIPNKAVGTLFLAKAATLTMRGGRVSMIQPASSLLFNRSGPANRFREKLFSQFKVEEVVNLSTLRFELFEKATSPPCIVTLRPTEPDNEPLVYIAPKQVKVSGGAEVGESEYAVIIEPHDISRVWPEEAISEPYVWTALAWGGRRDLRLVQRLSLYASIEQYRRAGRLCTSEGVIRGNRAKRADQWQSRRVLFEERFPPGTFLSLDARKLPLNTDPFFERPRTRHQNAFACPQVIIKQGWTVETGRFAAARTEVPDHTDGVVCSQSFVTVHAALEDEDILRSAVLTYNSLVAVHYLLLTSGRLASYRPEPLVGEMRSLPLAPLQEGILEGVRTLEDVDRRVRERFSIRDSEWVLIDDLFQYTMPDFKGDESSPGRQTTERARRASTSAKSEPHLSAYCEYFVRVLKAGFGEDKAVCATIYQDAYDSRLPVRLVAIHFDWPREQEMAVEHIDSPALCDLLVRLDRELLQTRGRRHGGVFFQRVARVYSQYPQEGRLIPTVYIIKPDRIRYWTRSAALRDADEVAADVQLWREQTRPRAGRGGK